MIQLGNVGISHSHANTARQFTVPHNGQQVNSRGDRKVEEGDDKPEQGGREKRTLMDATKGPVAQDNYCNLGRATCNSNGLAAAAAAS